MQAVCYRPLRSSDAEWYGSTFWTGPDWTRVGKNWHHPGHNTPSVRRFECPQDGNVSVTGRVFKLHLTGDGIRAMIRHNQREVWRAQIDGKDSKGKSHALSIDVKEGDAIRFVVHKRGQIYCDTTGWDPVVSYEGGAPSRASAAFAAKTQGAGGWFYEQEGLNQASPVLTHRVRKPPPVPVSAALRAELERLAPEAAPEGLALLAMVLEEWWREDGLDDTVEAYRVATTNHLERARLIAEAGCKDLETLEETPPAKLETARTHYLRVRLLKRELLLGHPLVQFGELLICKRRMPSYAHLVAQYYGWRQRGGGGLYVLRKPGRSLEVRDLVRGRLPQGSYLEPRLSYDGKRVLFAFVACDQTTPVPTSLAVNEEGPDEQAKQLHGEVVAMPEIQ